MLRCANAAGDPLGDLRHPAYAAPELLATGPNQLWSWDITKLKGPRAWTYFYLYVILDVFSRCVVGWMVMERESAGTLWVAGGGIHCRNMPSGRHSSGSVDAARQ